MNTFTEDSLNGLRDAYSKLTTKYNETIMMTICLWIMLAIVSGGGWFVINNLKHRMAYQQKELDWYRTNYVAKSGVTLWDKGQYLNYNLYSFDAGKNWYAIERGNNSFIVKGTAEEIFPGLLKHLQGMDALVEYSQKHGPITLSTPEELQVLENAGFTIKTNK